MGVAIAIYQDDFDLPHASVTTAEIHWMDQANLQLIIMCIHTPRFKNRTRPKYLQSNNCCFDVRLHVHIESKLKYLLNYAALTVCLSAHASVCSVQSKAEIEQQWHLFFFFFFFRENDLKGAVFREAPESYT